MSVFSENESSYSEMFDSFKGSDEEEKVEKELKNDVLFAGFEGKSRIHKKKRALALSEGINFEVLRQWTSEEKYYSKIFKGEWVSRSTFTHEIVRGLNTRKCCSEKILHFDQEVHPRKEKEEICEQEFAWIDKVLEKKSLEKTRLAKWSTQKYDWDDLEFSIKSKWDLKYLGDCDVICANCFSCLKQDLLVLVVQTEEKRICKLFSNEKRVAYLVRNLSFTKEDVDLKIFSFLIENAERILFGFGSRLNTFVFLSISKNPSSSFYMKQIPLHSKKFHVDGGEIMFCKVLEQKIYFGTSYGNITIIDEELTVVMQYCVPSKLCIHWPFMSANMGYMKLNSLAPRRLTFLFLSCSGSLLVLQDGMWSTKRMFEDYLSEIVRSKFAPQIVIEHSLNFQLLLSSEHDFITLLKCSLDENYTEKQMFRVEKGLQLRRGQVSVQIIENYVFVHLSDILLVLKKQCAVKKEEISLIIERNLFSISRTKFIYLTKDEKTCYSLNLSKSC
eukprot:snap_masked-scaffold_16-processed-gene-6.83-mRNA-1 protein AED:0.99 eAED:1.00 QI:0/0/0/0.5/1/1/2/0/500